MNARPNAGKDQIILGERKSCQAGSSIGAGQPGLARQRRGELLKRRGELSEQIFGGKQPDRDAVGERLGGDSNFAAQDVVGLGVLVIAEISVAG